MDRQVFVQVVGPGKSLVTDIAGEWLQSGVRAHMTEALVGPAKCPITALKLALERFFASMTAGVILKMRAFVVDYITARVLTAVGTTLLVRFG